MLLTSGVRHLKFWTCKKELKPTLADFGDSSDRNLSCIAFNGDETITGTTQGNLLVWNGSKIEKSIPLGVGPIDSLIVSKSYIVAGGRDMKVKVLGLDYNELSEIDVNGNQFKSINGQPRALSIDDNETNLVIGTFGCEIF